MAKLEWGKKRICPACGLKYYDFNKSPITCPTCNVEFDPDLYLKSRKGKSLSSKVAVEKEVDASETDDVGIETIGEVIDDDDEIINLNKDVKDKDNESDIDISFVDEEDINGEDVISVDVTEDEID